MTSAISATVVADYRMSGTAELLVVSASGEVRGYIPTPPSSGLGGGLEPLSTNKRKQQVLTHHSGMCLVFEAHVEKGRDEWRVPLFLFLAAPGYFISSRTKKIRRGL